MNRAKSILLVWAICAGSQSVVVSQKPAVDFATSIQPLLQASCYSCHGPDAQEGGLRLDHRRSGLAATDFGSLLTIFSPIVTAAHEPQDDLHTLVEVHTDEGLSGIGSVFTGSALTQAGIDFLEPIWRSAAADQPQRVSESLRQSSFWQGRGGTVEHVISGIDIALWDLFGKICNQPISKLLGGNYRNRIKPYGSMLFDEPDILAMRLKEVVDRGFQAIKLGWRPFGRRNNAFDEKLVATARDTVGPPPRGCKSFVHKDLWTTL